MAPADRGILSSGQGVRVGGKAVDEREEAGALARLAARLRSLRLTRRVLMDLLVDARRENEALREALARRRRPQRDREAAARELWRARTGRDPFALRDDPGARRQDSP